MLYLKIEFLPIIIYIIPSLVLRLCMLVLYVLLQVVACDRTPSSHHAIAPHTALH
ncbi:hypothetical protein [Nostoc sp.]|uniref:hypothetical protein n=1 Tax=Nostoc sp. TaxID=1180 RepID=UPI002FF7B1D8